MLPLLLTAAIVVIDGDTIRIGEERIRIENIDAPEMGGRASCLAERNLAELAKAYATDLLAGEKVEIHRDGTDRYGRTLARVTIDGEDFGELMIAGGYAVEWAGRRQDWC